MENISQMSLLEVAVALMEEKGSIENIHTLIKEVLEKKGLTDEDGTLTTKLYIDITTSSKFVYMGDDNWDLKSRQSLDEYDKDGSAFNSKDFVDEDEDDDLDDDLDEDDLDEDDEDSEDDDEDEDEDEDSDDEESTDDEESEDDEDEDDSESTDDGELEDEEDVERYTEEDDDFDEDKYNDQMDDYEDLYEK